MSFLSRVRMTHFMFKCKNQIQKNFIYVSKTACCDWVIAWGLIISIIEAALLVNLYIK